MIPTELVVTGKATTRTIGALADQMRSALVADTCVRLVISAVTDADLSFVQLIEAARRQLPAASLSLDRPANALMTALLRRAGFLTAATPADADFWFHGALPQ